MDDAYFLVESDLAALISYVAEYGAYGVGLGVVFWIAGYIVWFVIDALKGGV